MQACTENWKVHEAAVIAGRTHENLPQMRVGIRRLRSAFSLFRPVLSAVPAAEIVAHGLRAAALPFGRARDLDVLLSGPLAADLDSAQLDGLRTEREAAYDEVIAILRSPEWGQVRADLDAFVEAAPWGLAADPAPDVLADAALTKRRRRVVKGGADLRALTSHARHEVRIEAKKLRYGSEFFASVYADSGLVVDKPSGTVLTCWCPHPESAAKPRLTMCLPPAKACLKALKPCPPITKPVWSCCWVESGCFGFEWI